MLVQSLETAKNTLLNAQLQIQTTNHNIARADDKNYHRQEVVLETKPPLRYGGFFIGIGARIQQIKQNIDPLLEKRLLLAISQEQDYTTRASYFDRLTTYTFDDVTSGISASLQNFWNAWDAFNENPGEAEKQGVIKSAEYLAAHVSEVYRSLRNLQEDIDQDLANSIDRVNELLTIIADYNQQIAQLEIPNSNVRANDLRDERYAAIKELSEYLPISTEEDDFGRITITVEDGSDSIVLVTENRAGSIGHPSAGDFDYTDADGNHIAPSPHDLAGGKLFGLYKSYESVGSVKARFEEFAENLTNEVNAAHGSDVFDYNLAADDILTVDAGFNPDSSRALDVSNLQDAQIVGLSNLTFSQYLADIQHQIGTDHQNFQEKQELYNSVKLELEKQQQAVSGVSLDEELVNIIKFQHIFQAAARIIRATSEMLDTVINMV